MRSEHTLLTVGEESITRTKKSINFFDTNARHAMIIQKGLEQNYVTSNDFIM